MIKIQEANQEVQGFKRYFGIGQVTVEAINPTHEELKKLLGSDTIKEPEYKVKMSDGSEQTKIDIWVRTNPEWCNGIDLLSKITFFVSNSYVKSRDGSKAQVIDKYGETAWVTEEEFKSQHKPQNNQKLIPPYKPAKVGQADLFKFIRYWLGENTVPEATTWDSSKSMFVPKSDAEREKSEFDLNWDDIVSGKLTELKQYITEVHNMGNKHMIKVMFGVRTNDGKQYQTIYTRDFLRNSTTRYEKFYNDIIKSQQAGAMPNTEFSQETIHEYVIQKSTISKPDAFNIPQTPTPFLIAETNTTQANEPFHTVVDNDLPF